MFRWILLSVFLFACGTGPRWVNFQTFAAPKNPGGSYVAVYEPWSRDSVIKATSGEVLEPLARADFKASCVNIKCESNEQGVYIETQPRGVDHVEILVQPKEGSGLEPVHISIPFDEKVPLGTSYVVILRKGAQK